MEEVSLPACGKSHSVHTSGRLSFRGCRRRWNWIFRENWYPIETAKPLEFGTAYHKAMETYYDPQTWWMHSNPETRSALELNAIKVFVEKCESQKRKYLQLNPNQPSLEAEAQIDYDERLELGRGMLRYYFTVAPGIDNFSPIATEVDFEIPISHPKTGQPLVCDRCGAAITYGGRLDLLVRDEFGDLWILDWKTAATIREDDGFLDLDDQISSYCYALSQKLNVPIRGFIYHEQRKGFPKRPQENKVVRKGCKFSVNKQQDTSYDLYLQTIMEEDADAFKSGFYDEMLTFLRNDGITYHRRKQVHRSETELANVGEYIFMEASEMYRPDLSIYPSAGRFSCSFCAFKQPCLMKNGGMDYEYTLETMFEKRVPYWQFNQELSSDKSSRG